MRGTMMRNDLFNRGRFPSPWFAVQELGREVDRVFGRSGRGYAPLTLWEDQQHVYVEVDVPGLTMDQIELVLEQGKLFIRGERPLLPEGTHLWHDERGYGKFERVVRLSDQIDPSSTNAFLKHGVLQIQLAKRPEVQPQRITIRTEDETHNGSASE